MKTLKYIAFATMFIMLSVSCTDTAETLLTDELDALENAEARRCPRCNGDIESSDDER